MIATPGQRNRLMQKLRGGDMLPTKETESENERNERNESSDKERRFLWGTRSPDPWDLSR